MNSKDSIIHFLLDKTRTYLDEPVTNAKYDNDFLLSNFITPSMVNVMARVNLGSDNPIRLEHTITLAKGVNRYILPPNVGEIYRVGKINSESGAVEQDLKPRNEFDKTGPIWQIEGNTIAFRPHIQDSEDGETITIYYIPNGDFQMHYSDDGASLDGTKKIVTLDFALSGANDIGYFDKRDKAFTGAIIRLFRSGNTTVEERIIKSFDYATEKVTVDEAFVNVGGGTSSLRYEIVPQGITSLSQAIALGAAMDLAASRDVTAKKMNYLTTQYKIAIKSIIDNRSNMQARTGKRFDSRTIDNRSDSIMR